MAGPFLVQTGRAVIANVLGGGGTVPKYHGMGTGNISPGSNAATALTAEVDSRATGTTSRVTTTTTNDTFQSVGTQTAGSARAITEVGLFDASTNGNALILTDVSVINLANGDSLQVTYKVAFS